MLQLIQPQAENTAQKYGTGLLLASLIEAAELQDEEIRELLDPDMHLTTSSAECVKACCERLLAAKEKGEKVFVGGDYDADGICSTAIMKYTLDALRIQNGYYIPDRFKEGYGLSEKTVRMVHEKGYSLIITVDNGVSANEALLAAKELGMDVIVTDHHRIEKEIEADIVVHPDYMEEAYAYLSGAGVALEISRALIGENAELTALAAVAAIADVMPLWRETRKIVMNGMAVMKRGLPRSLTQLLYRPDDVNWTSIAFQIVPKLNSVGRMNDLSNVNTVVKYLLLHDEAEISRYAQQLNHVNDVRKQLSSSMTKEAEKLVRGDALEVIYKEDFHEGICGLAAGRLANTLHKPVLVMAGAGELIKGSGRSVPGFDMFAFFSKFECLAAFGGHEQAVGISVRREDYETFAQECRTRAEEAGIIPEENETKAILIKEKDITFESVSDLEKAVLLPKEMSSILFAVKDPEVAKIFRSPKVVKLTLTSGVECVIYASKGINVPEKPALIAGHLSINRWRNNITCQMEADYVE